VTEASEFFDKMEEVLDAVRGEWFVALARCPNDETTMRIVSQKKIAVVMCPVCNRTLLSQEEGANDSEEG
jgi:hypothetical protein